MPQYEPTLQGMRTCFEFGVTRTQNGTGVPLGIYKQLETIGHGSGTHSLYSYLILMSIFYIQMAAVLQVNYVLESTKAMDSIARY